MSTFNIKSTWTQSCDKKSGSLNDGYMPQDLMRYSMDNPPKEKEHHGKSQLSVLQEMSKLHERPQYNQGTEQVLERERNSTKSRNDNMHIRMLEQMKSQQKKQEMERKDHEEKYGYIGRNRSFSGVLSGSK